MEGFGDFTQLKEFEVFGHGLSNPWGFDFNDVSGLCELLCYLLFHIVQGGYFTNKKTHKNPYVYKPIETVADHHHLSAHGGARFT